MFSNLLKRTPKPGRLQCPEVCRQRKIVFCDWGFHGRADNDGWTFTYVDDVDFDPDQDLRCYQRTHLDQCGEVLSQFVSTQLRKNSRIKSSKGWRFVCLIEDGNKCAVPVKRRDRTPRTMLLFERDEPCHCEGRLHTPRGAGPDKLEKHGKRDSVSSYESDLPSPPPEYRSRLSTLTTLYENDSDLLADNS